MVKSLDELEESLVTRLEAFLKSKSTDLKALKTLIGAAVTLCSDEAAEAARQTADAKFEDDTIGKTRFQYRFEEYNSHWKKTNIKAYIEIQGTAENEAEVGRQRKNIQKHTDLDDNIIYYKHIITI